MTKTWLIAPVATSAMVMTLFACGGDDTVSTAAGQPSGPGPTVSSSGSGGGTGAAGGSGAAGGQGGTGQGGAGQGGAGQGGAGQGGASGMTCEMCADMAEMGACANQFNACMNNNCETWWDCYTDQCFAMTFTAACFMTCDQSIDNLGMALKTCLCTECQNVCTPFCP